MSLVFGLEQRYRLAPEQGSVLWVGTPTALNFILITLRILIITLNVKNPLDKVLCLTILYT